jgi:hypothetical protein
MIELAIERIHEGKGKSRTPDQSERGRIGEMAAGWRAEAVEQAIDQLESCSIVIVPQKPRSAITANGRTKSGNVSHVLFGRPTSHRLFSAVSSRIEILTASSGFDRVAMAKVLTQAELEIQFAPFYAIFQASVDRLLEFLKSDPFTFLVNGKEFESTVAEAIAISPAAFETLRANPLNRGFSITSESIESADFDPFLDFIRCREPVRLPRGRALLFISLCSSLGNDDLGLSLLSSLHRLPSDSASGNSGGRAAICEATIDECASQFYSYSADDLRFVDRQTLHRLLSSDALVIESEDWLLRLLVDLDVDRFDFFGHIEVSLLSASGISLLADVFTFDDLSEAVWLGVVSRLKGQDAAGRRLRHRAPLLDSLILRDIPSELRRDCGDSWALLYRGSRDGFAASNFHGKCDGRANTVTVIESTGGDVFGGFTPLAWDSSGKYKADNSGKSFLFTVKNPRGTEFRRFGLRNSAYAIYGHSSLGPVFGSHGDVTVCDGGNAKANSYTRHGGVYLNDTGIDNDRVFTGKYNFTLKEIEVFALTF